MNLDGYGKDDFVKRLFVTGSEERWKQGYDPAF